MKATQADQKCKHCNRPVRIQVGPGVFVHSEFDPAIDVDDRTSTKPFKHHAALG